MRHKHTFCDVKMQGRESLFKTRACIFQGMTPPSPKGTELFFSCDTHIHTHIVRKQYIIKWGRGVLAIRKKAWKGSLGEHWCRGNWGTESESPGKKWGCVVRISGKCLAQSGSSVYSCYWHAINIRHVNMLLNIVNMLLTSAPIQYWH